MGIENAFIIIRVVYYKWGYMLYMYTRMGCTYVYMYMYVAFRPGELGPYYREN